MRIKYWTINSLVASTLLGVFLKIIEETTAIKVYTLLLNVDYIPFVNRFTIPEWIEFLLHLLVGIIFGNVLQWVLARSHKKDKQSFFVIISCSIVLAICYYPVTVLSNKTPPFLSFGAFSWWVFGHVLFGFILAVGYNKIAKK